MTSDLLLRRIRPLGGPTTDVLVRDAHVTVIGSTVARSGMQVIGRRWCDDVVLAVGLLVEELVAPVSSPP